MSSAPGSIVCPSCGRLNSPSVASCAGCGAPLFSAFGSGPSSSSGGSPPHLGRTYHQEPSVTHRQYETDADERLQPLATRGPLPGQPDEGPHRRIVRRRLSNPPTIIGIVLAVVGLVIIAGIYESNARPSSEWVPGGSVWSVSPSTLTGMTVHVRWNSSYPGLRVLVVFGKPSCFSPSGVVGNASGQNGSLTSTMDPGTTYYVFGCVGATPSNVTLTLSFFGGLTLGELVAGFLAAIGFGLMANGLRGRSVTVVTR